jgi:hypothetical protein
VAETQSACGIWPCSTLIQADKTPWLERIICYHFAYISLERNLTGRLLDSRIFFLVECMRMMGRATLDSEADFWVVTVLCCGNTYRAGGLVTFHHPFDIEAYR